MIISNNLHLKWYSISSYFYFIFWLRLWGHDHTRPSLSFQATEPVLNSDGTYSLIPLDSLSYTHLDGFVKIFQDPCTILLIEKIFHFTSEYISKLKRANKETIPSSQVLCRVVWRSLIRANLPEMFESSRRGANQLVISSVLYILYHLIFCIVQFKFFFYLELLIIKYTSPKY